MEQKQATYHIIGAGIAGLFCARLLKQNHPQICVKVYEAADAPGGRARSYEDKDFGRPLDCATHVILGANQEMRQFVKANEWENSCQFWDARSGELSGRFLPFLNHVLKSCCNTPADVIAPLIFKNIVRQTFPWTKRQRRVFFSRQNLSPRIINLLSAYADEIYYNTKLLKIETQFGRAAQLNFNNRQIDLGAEDKVIMALDNRSCAKLLNAEELPHNSIINIFYHTSQKIFLPGGASFIGVVNGIADWIFVNDDILAVTISAADENIFNLQELARDIWKELDRLRGVNSAFIPPFKAFKHKHATIAQDVLTNERRPDDASTAYPNIFIAGDWTMKNFPCCMETAVLSAKRAVKAALKA